MIWILVLFLICIGSIIWGISDKYDDSLQCGLALFSGIILLGFLITIPLYRSDVHDQLAQRNALQNTYNNLRKNSNSYEMATVGKDIADWNAWLASAQYWHNTQWKWYWPAEVMTTKPIE